MAETPQQINDDILDISDALVRWFKGQQIPPGRAICAMCNTIAAMCVAGDEGNIAKVMDKAHTATHTIEGLASIMVLASRGM